MLTIAAVEGSPARLSISPMSRLTYALRRHLRIGMSFPFAEPGDYLITQG